MKKIFSTVILSSIILLPHVLLSEVLISLNPGTISFEKIANTNYYDATLSVDVAVQSDEEGWSLNLLGFPLVSDQGDIPPDRQYVKKQYAPIEEDMGAGVGYEQMNTTIHIGSGGVTSGYEVINHLYFRILVLDTDQLGIYQGEAKIQTDDEIYYAILSMTLEVIPYLDFSINITDLLFEVNGPPGVYDADSPIELTHNSNNTEWKIESSFKEISPSDGISGNSFFVNSSNYDFSGDEGAGEGYMKMNYPREVTNGTIGSTSGSTNLNYRIKTEYNHAPGEYTGTFELDSPEFSNPITLNTTVHVSGYLYIELSESVVNVKTTGPPGLYDGDRPIKLTVATNAEHWQVTAEGTDLTSSDDVVPRERVFLSSTQMQNIGDEGAGIGYMALGEKREVASGEHTELDEIAEMQVRIKTTFADRSGAYSGKINFVIVNLP